ncbi:P2X purinoceptor 7-like [Montipora foliosa]|uniref:P2X purinoceptor 7-like n=1 Tax=Montipora foliosa TaxID=591990 RepID=UPI0035F17643
MSEASFVVEPYQFEPILTESDRESCDDDSTNSDNGGYDLNEDRIGQVDWCICGNCLAMTTGRESVCCREHQKSCDKIPPAMSCITENENFSAVCTNPAVIETAFNQYLENEGPIDDEPLNDTYRYVAYRQYTYWIHKKLGRKIRIAIPSCVVKKTRESFPSESGSYRGFEYAH